MQLQRIGIQKIESNDSIKNLWWLHDSFWHAAVVREFGHDRANQLNLEVGEKIFRMLTITLLREKIIRRPRSIQDLMAIFNTVWKSIFFDGFYVIGTVEYDGNTAVWTETRCHAYNSLTKADMLDGYECGCQAMRNGVMKVLRLKPIHEIKESLANGDKRCVIKTTFSPKNKKAILEQSAQILENIEISPLE